MGEKLEPQNRAKLFILSHAIPQSEDTRARPIMDMKRKATKLKNGQNESNNISTDSQEDENAIKNIDILNKIE